VVVMVGKGFGLEREYIYIIGYGVKIIKTKCHFLVGTNCHCSLVTNRRRELPNPSWNLGKKGWFFLILSALPQC
jgi:hypothetical protein